jgi:hypothetical protein
MKSIVASIVLRVFRGYCFSVFDLMRFLFPRPLPGDQERNEHRRDGQNVNEQAQDHIPGDLVLSRFFYFHGFSDFDVVCTEAFFASWALSACWVNHNPPTIMTKGTTVTIMPTPIFFPISDTSDSVIIICFDG